MKRFLLTSALVLFAVATEAAHSAELFYENLSDAVRKTYGKNWAVFVPFTALPAAMDDPNRQGETYPGHLWNFAPATTANGGTVLEQANVYCSASQTPKPFTVGAATFKDYQNIKDLKLTGTITVGPVKITAIDAKYLKSVSISIGPVQRMYLPGANVFSSAVKNAVINCGPNYFYAVNGVLLGKVTISVAFDRSIDAGIAAEISSKIKADLTVHARVVQNGTADKPLIVQTDDVQVFAVQVVPVASVR